MSPQKESDRYQEMSEGLSRLPHITPPQVERWVNLQATIDRSRDFLIRAVPEAQINMDAAQKILEQRTYTLVFFGGTGVGKSTLINALLERNLLPTGAVTAVTGTIVYIEQAAPGEAETLTLNFWNRDEFASRVRRLCQLAEIEGFDITNAGEREQARTDLAAIAHAGREDAKTERDEYLDILLDCLDTYESHADLFEVDAPPPQVFEIDNKEALAHIREDGHKGNERRQIRIIRSATFKIQPPSDRPNLLMDGYLRIVDVPGLGAGMRLHEAITLEEMKREDAMIVLVTDAGRQRVDEMKSLAAVHWIKDNRLMGLSGNDLDEAAAKIFVAVNGGNVRQAFDRLNAGLPESDLEIREVTRHLAPNYWEKYRQRGDRRPYFLVMAPSALYLNDPENAPAEFASETERIVKVFGDQLGPVSADPLDPETREKLLALSEVPQLRDALITFIQEERVRGQLREAATRVRSGLQSLRHYYEDELANRGLHPPFNHSWESLQERRYENVLTRQQKALPRAFHAALLELSERTNSDGRFRRLVSPTLRTIQDRIDETIRREVEGLLESYGTEYWDDRDVTYDNLVWGTSGIEVPIKRILFQVELIMQEALANTMPQLAQVVADELEQTLAAHDILTRLERAAYDQAYTYNVPGQGEALPLGDAYRQIIGRVRNNFRETCRQATLYELVRPERSINQRLESGERTLAAAGNEDLLDVALHGPAAQRGGSGNAVAETAVAEADEIAINILDGSDAEPFDINVLGDDHGQNGSYVPVDAEPSYADRLESVGDKTFQLFSALVDDLLSDDDLLARLRRCFWLEATRAERDFNLHLVKPMLRQHDRNLHTPELRQAMEMDLESLSDVEELMRVWEGLDALEGSVNA